VLNDAPGIYWIEIVPSASVVNETPWRATVYNELLATVKAESGTLILLRVTTMFEIATSAVATFSMLAWVLILLILEIGLTALMT